MEKVKDITQVLTLNKAIYILNHLEIEYDYEILKGNPDICKSIVAMFEDDFENI